MMNSIKRMTLIAVAVTVMVVCLAAPAMAHNNKAQDEHKNAQEEEPLKDPGIRLCDITPTECEDTEDSKDEQGYNSGAHPDAKDPNKPDEEEPLKDPGIRQCDILPIECPDTEDSKDDHDHNPGGAYPDADNPNPVQKEEPKEEASAPGTVAKVGEVAGGITTTAQENDASAAPKEVVSAPDEVGQIANSGDVVGCPFDYEYDEDLDVCLPSPDNYDFFPVLYGDEPLPDSVGGYLALPGEAAGDVVLGLGTGISAGGAYLEKALVWYGEDGGPIGWGFQGLGYTIGFATEVAGTIVSGAGDLLGGVSDAVGDAVDAVGAAADAVGDAAEDAWDTVSGWF